MSLIELTNFSQDFGDRMLFDNTNFVLNNNEKIGLIGLNGMGKSTLIKILTGEVLVNDGKIYKHPKYVIKCLDQHATVEGNQTIKEYLSEAYKDLFDVEKKLNEINEKIAVEKNPDKQEKLLYQSGDLFEYLEQHDFYSIDSEIQKVAAGLGVNALGMDTIVSTLSGGQRAKVMLSKLLLESPDVLILDEPTNFLDVNHIDWLIKFIKTSDKAFLIVSHDEHFLNEIVTHICEVENGKIVKYSGNLTKYKEIKALKNEQLAKTFKTQQKEIKKLEDYIAKNKARAATAKMAHSRERKLEKMDLVTPPTELVKPSFSFKQKEYMGTLMLKVSNLQVGYSKALFKNPISFEVCKGDRLAIVGFNGIGKSTLLKTIIGEVASLGGKVELSRNVLVGYYEQENNFKGYEGTPLNYILREFPKLSEKESRALLNKCGVTVEQCRRQVGQLSGGEQSKMKLCKLCIKPNNLLILDEPTNHLDYLAIERLEEAIKEYDGAVIFVSHSKPFVNSLATKVIDLEKMN